MIQSDWHPEDVKAALRKAGTPLYPLVASRGYCGNAGGKALRQSWPKVERIIAAALNKHPKEIWPSRYDREGNPKREGRWPHHNTAVRVRVRQKSMAG